MLAPPVLLHDRFAPMAGQRSRSVAERLAAEWLSLEDPLGIVHTQTMDSQLPRLWLTHNIGELQKRALHNKELEARPSGMGLPDAVVLEGQKSSSCSRTVRVRIASVSSMQPKSWLHESGSLVATRRTTLRMPEPLTDFLRVVSKPVDARAARVGDETEFDRAISWSR